MEGVGDVRRDLEEDDSGMTVRETLWSVLSVARPTEGPWTGGITDSVIRTVVPESRDPPSRVGCSTVPSGRRTGNE